MRAPKRRSRTWRRPRQQDDAKGGGTPCRINTGIIFVCDGETCTATEAKCTQNSGKIEVYEA